MIKEAIKKLVAGNDLTFDEAAQVMDEMFSGTATQSQMAAYLTALRIKGETIDEITASAQVMREKALHIKPNRRYRHIQYFNNSGIYNCRRRNPRCKARQPFNVKQKRFGRLS